MNFRLEKKKQELLEKCPDPRNPLGKINFQRKEYALSCPPTYGIVADNKDPECLGRLKLILPLVGPNAVTPWYQVAGNRKDKNGFWALPDIGTQVIVCFPYGNYSHGIILGCIYDMKHKPPKHDTENPSNSQLIQTKKHRIEIINEDGKEEIRVETAEGQMRAILSKNGVELINELDGGIELSGKKINLKGKNVNIVSEKSMSLKSDGPVNCKEKGKFTLTSDKDVTLKGKNIKMSGSKGVAAEGKQIAVQDDKVMGFDVHIMVVPSGNGTTTVPLPHPFIGKLADKLSKDVKIKDKACATKDSVAKHDDTMHMQLPGTIKFQNNPKKEGNVTGGTSPKVKINGKEAAVIGSQVSTCNDVGAQNNSTVIAPGASMPMPVIINPKNTEEWKREQEEAEKKEPKFSSVKWGTSSVEEGKEVELTASVQDIEDGNMVTLQVFPEGKGPEDGVPIASFPLTVKGGSVSAKWSYHANKSELPPDSNPKFVFSAHCAWCNFEKSSNSVEVKLIRPEIKKAEWQDKDGGSTSKGLVGETLKLHAETKDMEGGVTFRVYDDKGRQVFEKGAEIEGDKAEAEWNPIDTRQPDDTQDLKYTFEVTGNRCKTIESSECQVKNPRVVSMEWEEDFAYPGDTVKLKINTLEMADLNYSGILRFYDKEKQNNSNILFTKEISLNNDTVECDIEIPKDISFTYKDDAGFAKLCAELFIEETEYTYVEKNLIDILTDFVRE